MAAVDDTRAQSAAHLKGIAWMGLSGTLFVGVTLVVRMLGDQDMSAVQAAFMRYLFGLILILPLVARVRRLPRRDEVGWYGLRGFFHAGGLALWFFSATRIPVAEVTALGFTAPIFATVGAALFLRETLHMRRLLAVLVAFAGTMVILRPGFAVVDIGAWAQVIGAPMFAASMLIGKRMTRTQTTTEIVVYLSVFVTMFLAIPAAFVWQTPTLAQVGWLAVVAVLATLGHFTMTQGLRATDIAVTQPVWFTQLVLASIAGMVLFGEQPLIWTYLGSAMIIGSATYIAHREALRGRRVRPPESVGPPGT